MGDAVAVDDGVCTWEQAVAGLNELMDHARPGHLADEAMAYASSLDGYADDARLPRNEALALARLSGDIRTAVGGRHFEPPVRRLLERVREGVSAGRGRAVGDRGPQAPSGEVPPVGPAGPAGPAVDPFASDDAGVDLPALWDPPVDDPASYGQGELPGMPGPVPKDPPLRAPRVRRESPEQALRRMSGEIYDATGEAVDPDTGLSL